MHCPNDNTVLQMTSREGIEIDYCPTCRGVWLDRGELDKIIERGSAMGPASHGAPQAAPIHAAPINQPHQQQHTYRHDDEDDDDHHYERRGHDSHGYDNNHHGHHKKKEGFLGDLFDF